MEVVAWIGSILLAVCAVPQAYKCFVEKHAHGLSAWMLGMWTTGELLLVAYTFHIKDFALFFNYAANLFVIGIIVRYKIWPEVKHIHVASEAGRL
jgi:uncharacterized protein with PQ loop repeat